MSNSTLSRINRIISVGMASSNVIMKLIEELLLLEHSEDDYEVSTIYILINGVPHIQVNENFNGYKSSELFYIEDGKLNPTPEGFWHLQGPDIYEI